MARQSSPPTRNPFPAEAVATYGKDQITCEDLEYMSKMGAELHSYLRAYPDESRYGGAIGMKGAHGSGKTHILNWLADTAKKSQKIRSTVFYGKCDSSSFFDLYRQFTFEHFGRETLMSIIQLALLNLARAKVREAAVTEQLASRLETAGALQELQKENNIDLQQLHLQLLQELTSSGTPMQMARVILEVPDADRGENAHRWLTANDIAVKELEALGINYQLSRMSQTPGTTGAPVASSAETREPDPEVVAIMALSAIATLHRVAGVPLIVFVDQLEVLMRVPDGPEFQTLASLLKKFIEELGSRSALVFIAGTPEPWKRLPRDVPPRFRGRAETVVGGLTAEETTALLSAYTEQVGIDGFGPEISEQIRKLSGGNPREILRIAHQLFDDAKGNVSGISDDAVVLRAAQQAGTVADRAAQALISIDAVIPEFGRSAKELEVPGGGRIDRVLIAESGQPIAVFEVIRATDALDEIDSARRVQNVRRYVNETWGNLALVVISVGYASDEVRHLLTHGVTLLPFNEKTFEGELRTLLLALSSKSASTAAVASSKENGEVKESLDLIARKLRELETARVQDQRRIEERFSRSAAELAQPAIQERRLVTRREMLDALDLLREQVGHDDLTSEQKLIRSVLIANEAHLHNRAVDDLGEVFLETIAIQRQFESETENLVAERMRIVETMSRTLRRPTIYNVLASRLPWMGWAALALFIATILSGLYSTATHFTDGRIMLLPFPEDFASFMPFFFATLLTTLLYVMFAIWFFERTRERKWRNRLEELRSAAARAGKGRSIRATYPQATL